VVVPGYEILGELGRGGMGVVYQARQVSLNRVVALKMILAGGHAGQTELARFRGEAEALACLQHPNIVQIFETGQAGGFPFLSLEFVAGGSLAAQLDGTPWAPAEAAELVEDLARAVHAAHQRGIVHRDLKPGNVLLTAQGIPKITDFGLAKRLDSETARTQSGAILGTPSYMAPEQAEGKRAEIGPAADVYALGAILYELLTGHPPFQAETPLETVLQVISEEVMPPRQLCADVPRDLQAVCMKCLAKAPRQRYASAKLLAADLRRFVEGEPVRARYRGSDRRRWWCDRVVISVVALVVLSVVGGTVGFLLSNRVRRDLEPPRRRPVIPVPPVADLLPRFQMPEIPKPTGTLRIWNTATGEALVNVQGADAYLHHLIFSPDGKRLAGSGSGGLVTVRDAATGDVVLTAKGSFVAFSPDSRRVIVGAAFGLDTLFSMDTDKVKVLDTHDGHELRSFGKVRAQITAMALSRDGRRLATLDRGALDQQFQRGSPALRVWDAETGQAVFSKNLDNAPFQLTFSPDDKRLVAPFSAKEAIKVWDAETGQEQAVSFQGLRAVLSNDGALVATTWTAGPVKIWDATTSKELYTLEGMNPAFSPDSATVATTAYGNVKLWNVKTGMEILALKDQAHRIEHVAFSPDSKRLAGALMDGSVLIWDTSNGQRLHKLVGHPTAVGQMLFSPDGTCLATASFDGLSRAGNAAQQEKQTPPAPDPMGQPNQAR
jgi:WD40 repeat protein